ncbi:MAG TPA: hydrolase [Dehalococcoidia bacterium]|nr:hydrolase [Dehalococcoidia bacterium]HAS27592.1 hydrolase [Dehalococcoidia bacterium]
MLKSENTVLLIVDVQEKLLPVIYREENLTANIIRLIQGMQVLEIPVIVTEQYPKGLGETVPEIAQLLTNIEALPKTSFSCYGDEAFRKTLEASGRKQVLICGIETHVCVYQTAMDLQEAGYEVQVIANAVSSRTPGNKEIGLNLMRQMGITITGAETVLFEMLKVAEGDKFKAISNIVK